MICRVSIRLAALALLMVAIDLRAADSAKPLPDAIEFNRDIRPILSNNCFMCHGPDSHQRKAKLRFDSPEDPFVEHENGVPLVPGNLEKSQVIRHIESTDPDEMMPPPDSEKKLTRRQIEMLRKWVVQGAKYEKHWAFIVPKRPELPEVKDAAWCRNPIDRFVLARLEQEGLHPSPEADKTTLCRRLYLDLLGLPPTPQEVDQFVADTAPDAYEKLVDRLLASPHYGERMALDWLDAARFADTQGYHIDSGRDQTRWRDWVINAFNANKPFDQFTIEQLAGDLLPNSTIDQKIATGFVRNNMINFEGGAIPEEYLTAYLMDRVKTTSMVWLGLTLNCCQCHDHKFDPFTQKDYYQLYAFFNAVPEKGLDGKDGNAAPVLATPTKEQQLKLDALASSITDLKKRLAEPMPDADAEQLAWESNASSRKSIWTALVPSSMTSQAGATFTTHADKSILVTGPGVSSESYVITAPAGLSDITAIRLEALTDPSLPHKGPGRSPNGNVVLTDFTITFSPSPGVPGEREIHEHPVKFSKASADFSQDGFPVDSLVDGKRAAGWAIYPQIGKPHTAVFELEKPIHSDGASTLNITLGFHSGFGEHQFGRFRLSVTDSKSPKIDGSVPAKIRRLLAASAENRSKSQESELRTFFRENVCPETRALGEQLASLTKEKETLDKQVPTTMVMVEMAKPRETYILLRGQYDKHGDVVTASVPTQLAPLPAGAPMNRLGLAEWLVSPRQPMTGRVTVNRFWQSFFGVGIVKTVEDFGSQGDEPSNPELLDWLAVQFTQGSGENETPWNVKAIVKLMVTSATYRQSSAATPELIARDPENRLLARGPRFRLQAEFIRDQALAASGLLTDQIGGRSVNPYQPAGLWEELMSRGDGARFTAQTYVQDHGKDLYRRTMYTFWKRTSPPASLSTFDAPGRETCTVRRARTNTPLQALVLMNDPTYVEASRKIAERMLTEAGASDEAKIAYAFRLAMARAPRPAEIAVLERIYNRESAIFRADPESAKKLLSVGESPRNEKLDACDLAAWSTVASVILNLDETITKG